jgi:hypothetical protein
MSGAKLTVASKVVTAALFRQSLHRFVMLCISKGFTLPMEHIFLFKMGREVMEIWQ